MSSISNINSQNNTPIFNKNSPPASIEQKTDEKKTRISDFSSDNLTPTIPSVTHVSNYAIDPLIPIGSHLQNTAILVQSPRSTLDSNRQITEPPLNRADMQTETLLNEPLSFSSPSEDVICFTDPRIPPFHVEGDSHFREEIVSDLTHLLSRSRTAEFLTALSTAAKQRGGTQIKIIRGQESENDPSLLDTQNVITVRISQEKGYVVCKNSQSTYTLQAMPSSINLAHELTHSYHNIRNEKSSDLDTGGFDTLEERNTIGTFNVDTQQFTENGYRAAFEFDLRAGHYGIPNLSPSTEENLHAIRNSIALGCQFAFASYDMLSLETLYNPKMYDQEPFRSQLSASERSEKKVAQRTNIENDIKKLLEHATSEDPQTRAFAFEMLRAIAPHLENISSRTTKAELRSQIQALMCPSSLVR